MAVVMAGDFNATWGNRAFRRLLDAGLAAVAIRTGEGRGSDHRPIVADIVRTVGGG